MNSISPTARRQPGPAAAWRPQEPQPHPKHVGARATPDPDHDRGHHDDTNPGQRQHRGRCDRRRQQIRATSTPAGRGARIATITEPWPPTSVETLVEPSIFAVGADSPGTTSAGAEVAAVRAALAALPRALRLVLDALHEVTDPARIAELPA